MPEISLTDVSPMPPTSLVHWNLEKVPKGTLGILLWIIAAERKTDGATKQAKNG